MFTLIRSWWESRTRWEKTAIVIWSVLLLCVSVRVFFAPTKRTVYPIFSGSAQLWWAKADLYEPYRPSSVQGGYRYSPTFAILLTPLALLPDSVGGALWRLLSTAAFFGSLAWLARSVMPLPLARDSFAWLALFCLPLTLQSLNNGQANLLVIASMLAAVAAVKEQRWNLATLLIVLAFVCKVYPLALGMLLILLYPRPLFGRMALALLASLLVPFLLQEPDYVADQYGKWIALLRADDRTAADPHDKHRDLWLLIDIYGIPLSRRFYQLLQLGSGAGIAALLWRRQCQGWAEKSLLTSTLALGTAWMLLLGPVVESSTFVLLVPSLACSLYFELHRASKGRQFLLLGSAALFVAAVVLGSIANTAKLHVMGVHPWASLCYFVYLLTQPRPLGEPPLPQSQLVDARAAA